MKKLLFTAACAIIMLAFTQTGYAYEDGSWWDEETTTYYDGRGTWYTGKDAVKKAGATKKFAKKKEKLVLARVSPPKTAAPQKTLPPEKPRIKTIIGWWKPPATPPEPRPFSFMQTVKKESKNFTLAPHTRERFSRLAHMIESNYRASDMKKLNAVNRFFNRNIWNVSDERLWGTVDYWATPIETLKKGAGDCEDYAIAKYFTLRTLGIPKKRLGLVYGRANGVPHMILAYYPPHGGEALALDNLTFRIRKISRASIKKPEYEFNEDSLWMRAQKRTTSASSASAANIFQWNILKQKVSAGG